jgi:hypothetical protein
MLANHYQNFYGVTSFHVLESLLIVHVFVLGTHGLDPQGLGGVTFVDPPPQLLSVFRQETVPVATSPSACPVQSGNAVSTQANEYITGLVPVQIFPQLSGYVAPAQVKLVSPHPVEMHGLTVTATVFIPAGTPQLFQQFTP